MRVAVFTMIGPGPADAARLRTMLASLLRYEPAVPLLVVIDDSGGDAVYPLRDLLPATCEVVRLPNSDPPTIHHLGVNTICAMRYLAARGDVDVVVKLDSDAMVIAPFAAQLATYFREHAGVGQVGRAERRCDGQPTEFGYYVRMVRKQRQWLQVWRSPTWGVKQAFVGPRARVRNASRRAAANGLPDGAHCQGGAYALSAEALRRLQAGGWLANNDIGRGYGLAEDLMTSTLVAATGLRVASLTADGEPFGVEAHGLPFSPEETAARGYALVHSIKNDRRFSEAEIVAYFERRGTPAAV